MADELKRVGLIFKEDGSHDFVKTLKLVNSNLRENYQNFKLVQTQWDESTKASQKLKDKLEYLNNAYEIQKDKVTTLKIELRELESEENKNEVAILNKRAALANAEVSLEKYSKQIEELNKKIKLGTEDVKEFANNLENSGKKIESVGKKVSVFSTATLAAMTASIKEAINFEDAWTGVTKTVDGTDKQLKDVRQGIKDMAEELPSTTTEIAGVAEAAGQLGIKVDDILSFTKVMIDLGNSTNLSASEAAMSLAKFANITNLSSKDYDRLGSVIVELGNNFATTEADIVSMATRLASTGEITGLSQAQILALATALSSAGIEAEAGGSAISKLLKTVNLAVEVYRSATNVINQTGYSLRELQLMASNNSKDFKALANNIGLTSEELKSYMKNADSLEDFARVAGVTAEEFQRLYGEDSIKALSAFIIGLQDTERNGKNAVEILNDMGLTEVRLSNAILSLSTSSSLMTNAIETANTAWDSNTALTEEANKRYETLKSRITITINKIKNNAEVIGNKMLPTAKKWLTKLDDWTDKLKDLDEEQVETILKIATMVTTIGPLIIILGKLTTGTAKNIKSLATFIETLGKSNTAIGKVTSSLIAMCGGTTGFLAVSAVVGGAILAISKFKNELQKLTPEQKKLIKETDNITESVKEEKKAYDELKDSKQKMLDANLSEADNIQNLYYQLKNITDENGNIIEGYEERADFIINQLNQAFDLEITRNGNVVESYKELEDTIDSVIRKKRAEIILEAEEESYREAIQNQNEAYKVRNELEEKRAQLLEKIKQINEKINSGEYQTGSFTADLIELTNLKNQANQLEEEFTIINNSISTQNGLIEGYAQDIATYEADVSAVLSGSSEEIQQVIGRTTYKYIQSTEDIGSAINQQIVLEEQKLETYKNLYQQQVDANNEANAEIYKTQMESQESTITNLANTLVETTNKVSELTPELTEAWRTLAIKNENIYKEKISELAPDIQAALNEMMNSAEGKNAELTEKFKEIGKNILFGFNSTAGTSKWSELGSSNALAFTKAFREKMDIHSPSRKMKEAGKNTFEGFKQGNSTDEYKKLAEDNAEAFNSNFESKLNFSNNTSKNLNPYFSKENNNYNNLNLLQIFKQALKESGIIELLQSILEATPKNIYIDKDLLVGATIDTYNQKLAKISEQEKRG